MVEEIIEKKPEISELHMDKIKNALAHIEGDLRRLEMESWFSPISSHEKVETRPPCGTRACFGGWLVIQQRIAEGIPLEEAVHYGENVFIQAKELAGFTVEEAALVFTGEACNLFVVEMQFAKLKEILNKVFAARGIPDRV